MARVNYKARSAAAVLIPVALLAAGCSSGKSAGSNPAGSTPTAPGSTATSTAAGATGSAATPTGATKAGIPVTATEKEFSIALSAKTFSAGVYTFTVHNAGKFSHNLTIEGPGVDKQASPTMPSGGTGTLTVTLQKGSYEIWCSVDGHKDEGMDMNIQVS